MRNYGKSWLAAFEAVSGTRPDDDRLMSSMKPGERAEAVRRVLRKYHDGRLADEMRKLWRPGDNAAGIRRLRAIDQAALYRRDTWRGMKPDMDDPAMVALKQRLTVRWALEKSDAEFGARAVPTRGMDGEGI